MGARDFEPPYPVQFQGSAFGRWLLARIGWRVEFEGLPASQGVLAVYPHTSNWDFVVLYIVKWALGIPVRYWAKDSLFRIPLFGTWLRSFGGVPIVRGSAQGVVTDTVAQIREVQERGGYFWLAAAPEGTRKLTAGWRSGSYRVAVQAGVPLGLVRLDYARREVRVTDFLRLTGDESQDFARIVAVLEGAVGRHPENAGPIRLSS